MQYLARFGTPAGDDVLQGLVAVPAKPRLRRYYPDRWFERLAQLGAARAGIRDCEVSLRSSLREGRLQQLVIFPAPGTADRELRHYLASYFELLALVDGSVALPPDRSSHDAAI